MKKRVLVFTSTFPRWVNDDIPHFVYELSALLAKDFDVHVLTPSFPGAKKQELMGNVKVKRFRHNLSRFEDIANNEGILPSLNKNKLNYLKVFPLIIASFFALIIETKKIKPDVVHAHWIIPQGFIAALSKKLTGVPFVVTGHGGDVHSLKGKVSTKIKKFTLKNAKHITVVSQALKNELLNEVDPNLKIDVIPMGVDTNIFNTNKRSNLVRAEHGINAEFLLFVGRLAPEKGVSNLIDAMPEIIKTHPNAKLMIIGKGVLEDELKKKVKLLNLDNKVIFKGWVHNRDLPAYYATADVFVGPSLREGFGLTFVEAGFCGCWLVGTKVGGITDIIREGENGTFTSGDLKDLAEKIISSFKKKNFTRLEDFEWGTVHKRYSEVLV